MPTYEYKCSACGHAFERFHSMSATPIKKCPECGKSKVQRLLGTGAGLIFKGSGFYITDYRSEGYRAAAKTESSAGHAEAKANEPKAASTEAKSAGSEGGSAAGPKKTESKPAADKTPKTPKTAD